MIYWICKAQNDPQQSAHEIKEIQTYMCINELDVFDKSFVVIFIPNNCEEHNVTIKYFLMEEF